MAAIDDLLTARKALLDAIDEGYIPATEFYDGETGDVFASAKIRRLLAKSGADEVEDFNYSHIPVDAISDKLRILSVSGVVGSDTETDDNDAGDDDLRDEIQQAIDNLIKDNDLRQEWHGLHHGVSKLGDYYMKVWPVTAKDAPTDVVSVEMRIKSPERVRVFYSAEDPLEKEYAVEMWEVMDSAGLPRKRINLYYPDVVQRWWTQPKLSGDKPDDWVHYDGDGKWEIPNPCGEVPFFHYRTDRPYGKPEHINAYGPQQMINKLVSAHGASIDFLAFPQRYMLMDPASTDRMSNLLDPDHPEDEDDDPESPAGQSALKADPAAVWRLWAKSVGQFDPASPEQFLTPFDRYVQAMSELTGVPAYRFGSKFGATPSGSALRVADQTLTNRAKDRCESYGAEHANAFELALRLVGFDDVEVMVTWQPVEAVTDKEGWDVVQAKITAGVPIREALIEAGYLPNQVDDWLNEPGGALMIQRMALLGSIGTFIQAASSGVATGVVTPESVRRIVDMVIGANTLVTEEDLKDDGTMPKIPPKPVPPPPPAPPDAAPGGAARPPARATGPARPPARSGGTRSGA